MHGHSGKKTMTYLTLMLVAVVFSVLLVSAQPPPSYREAVRKDPKFKNQYKKDKKNLRPTEPPPPYEEHHLHPPYHEPGGDGNHHPRRRANDPPARSRGEREHHPQPRNPVHDTHRKRKTRAPYLSV